MTRNLFIGLVLVLGQYAYAQETVTNAVLDLPAAFELAKSNYPSIKAKLAEQESSEYELRAAKNTYLPNLIVQGQILNGTSNQVRGVFFPNEGMAIPVSGGIKTNGYTGTSVWTSYATGLVNWKFFNFGKVKSAVAAATAGTRVTEADYQNEIFSHLIKVGDAYLLDLITKDILKSQQANVDRVKALKDVTSAYTQSGLKPGVDSSLVNAEYSKAVLQFLEAKRNYREQDVYLKELLGLQDDGQTLQLDTTLYANKQPQNFVQSNNVTNNPRLLFYKSVSEYNEAKIKSIRRKEYPSISFLAGSWARGSGIADKTLDNGNFSYDKSFSGGVQFRPYLDWMVGVSTIWNITTLVKTGNEAKSQRSLAAKAVENYNEEVLKVEGEVTRALLRYNAALEVANQAPIQLRAANDAYLQAKARYDAGFNTILELTQSFALLNRAESDLSMAKGNVWRAVLQYAAATGDFELFTKNLN